MLLQISAFSWWSSIVLTRKPRHFCRILFSYDKDQLAHVQDQNLVQDWIQEVLAKLDR